MKNYFHKILLASIDILCLIGLLYANIFFTSDKLLNSEIVFQNQFVFIISIIFFLFYYERIYTFRYDFWQETHKVFKSLVLSYLIVMTLIAISNGNNELSKTFITIYFISAVIFVPTLKRVFKKIIYFFDYFKKKVLVISHDKESEKLKKEFKDNWYLGQQSVESEYECVVIISKGFAFDKLNEVIKEYLNKSREVYVIPYITDINFANSNILEYANIRSSTIHVENKLLISRNIFIKESFEKLFAFILMPFLFLIHGIIVFLIKIDSKGKAIFKQKRLGKKDKDFKCYKYRTMYENSEELLKEYLDNNPDEKEYYEEYHKYKNDPRITRVGKFLRSTSLDELPQFFNVLRGDMSLVGPRPYMLREKEKLGSNKDLILKVKPGITGLWQVSGRNNLTFSERNRLDIWYVRNWSLELDIRIILKTIKVVIYKVGSK